MTAVYTWSIGDIYLLFKNDNMERNALSALAVASSRFNPPSGCLIITMGNKGIPWDCACNSPNVTNASVQMVIVGIPLFSSSIESWILHDVHEPQSPIALITR